MLDSIQCSTIFGWKSKGLACILGFSGSNLYFRDFIEGGLAKLVGHPWARPIIAVIALGFINPRAI